MASTNKRGGKGVSALEVGAALAAAGAAAAGYYFYGDKDAKKHRQAATKWARGMKADVVAEAKKLKKLDRAAMVSIVNQASQAYQEAKNVDKNDLKAAAAELKKNWRKIEDEIRGAVAKVPAAKKLMTKKAAPKKAAKKPAKKKTTKKSA